MKKHLPSCFLLLILLTIFQSISACSDTPVQTSKPESYESLRDAIKATISEEELEKLSQKLKDSKLSKQEVSILEGYIKYQKVVRTQQKNKGFSNFEIAARGIESETDLSWLEKAKSRLGFELGISMVQNEESFSFGSKNLSEIEIKRLKLRVKRRIIQIQEFDDNKFLPELGIELGEILVIQGKNNPVLIQRVHEQELACHVLPSLSHCYLNDWSCSHEEERKAFVKSLAIQPNVPIDVSELQQIGAGGQNKVYAFGKDVLRLEKIDKISGVLAFVRMIVAQNLPGVVKIKRILKDKNGSVAVVFEKLEKKDLSKIDEKRFAKISLQLASTLQKLHNLTIKHEDISERNIMFRDELPVFIDFGGYAQRFTGVDLPDLAFSLMLMRTANCDKWPNYVLEFARKLDTYTAFIIHEHFKDCNQSGWIEDALAKLAQKGATLDDFIMSMQSRTGV